MLKKQKHPNGCFLFEFGGLNNIYFLKCIVGVFNISLCFDIVINKKKHLI